MRAVFVRAVKPCRLAKAERSVERDRRFEIGARHGDERDARGFTFDELERGSVGIVGHDEADLAAAGNRMRERFAPGSAAELAYAADRGVEVGHDHAEPLEAAGLEPRG